MNLLETIHATPHLDWLLLTKRPENFQPRMDEAYQFGELTCDRHIAFINALGAWSQVEREHAIAWDNVWLGTTVENQEWADKRIPHLLGIPAAVRFLSCEPLLGPVDLTLAPSVMAGGYNSLLPYRPAGCASPQQPRIHWVIAGGESGAHARPMHPAWARSLRDQCAAAGVPFLFKQWGEWLPLTPLYDGRDEDAEDGCNPDRTAVLHDNGHLWPWEHGQPPAEGRPWIIERTGKKAAGRLLDGVRHHAFPS